MKYLIAELLAFLLIFSGCSSFKPIVCPIWHISGWCPPTPTPTATSPWTPTPQATKTPAPPPVGTPTANPSWSPSPAAPSPSSSPVRSPSPAPSIPPAPFGQVVNKFPSAVAGSLGSVNSKDGQLIEYCRGEAALYFRSIASGAITQKMNMDARLKQLWAVAWDSVRGCYWATNPEESGINWNLIQVSSSGQVIGGSLMLGGTSNNPIRIYDLESNWTYATTIDGNPIDAGTMFVSDRHVFSGSQLIKVNFITVDVEGYWEQFWWAVDISFRADARTGCTYWLACDADNPVGGEYPIYEYRQALYRKERCDASARTGRKIIVPGVWFSSLFVSEDGSYIWGKGINAVTGESAIYQISLGTGPAHTPPMPSPTPSICGGGNTPSPSPSPESGDLPFEITLSDSTITAVVVDSAGCAYITGSSTNPDLCRGFDTYRTTYPGASAVFAAKIDRAGRVILATYISTGNGQACAVDSAGNVYLGGGVTDDAWPVTPGCFQAKRPGTTPNAYLCKLDPTMSRLLWSTYLGGGLQHAPDAPDGGSIKNLATDEAGNVYFIASSQDNDFPLGTNGRCIIGYRPPCAGCYTVYEREHTWGCSGPGQPSKWSNVILGKFSPSGECLRMTNPGGSGPDTTSGAFAVSPAGDIYYGARTKSTQENTDPWPSTRGSARDLPYNGGQAWFDGAAGRLRNDMAELVWASFLGGHAQNNPFGAAVDSASRVTVTGYTKASDFPVVNAVQPKFGGDHDCFVSRFSSSGAALDFSTYLGGPGYDSGSAAAVDSLGRPWICGQGSKGYPTTDGSTIGSSTSSVVSRFSADGRTLEYSTARHGGQDATGIALTPGYYLVTITAGDDGLLVKERQ